MLVNLAGVSIYTVRMYNVDDLAKLYINDTMLYRSTWGYFGTPPDWYYYGHDNRKYAGTLAWRQIHEYLGSFYFVKRTNI